MKTPVRQAPCFVAAGEACQGGDSYHLAMLPSPPPAFKESIQRLGLEFEPGDVERLGRFLDVLLETNKEFNLTGITDPEMAWMRHIVDSLALVPMLVSARAQTVIDVGSGGGLPGIPLAIVLPDVQFTLVESTGKKAKFLGRAATTLQLDNVDVVNDRAETIGQDHHHHRERYDVALARAVGRLPVLLELTVPLVKTGGLVLAIKGERAEEEIAEAKPALHMLHAGVANVVRGETGTIIVIEKHRKTPRLYPRTPGEPKRVPLGVPRIKS